MDCGYREKIIMLFYGEGDEDAYKHMLTCADCQARFEALAKTRKHLESFSPNPSDEIIAALLTAGAQREAFDLKKVIYAFCFAASVFLAFVFVGGNNRVASLSWDGGFEGALDLVEYNIAYERANINEGHEEIDYRLDMLKSDIHSAKQNV